MRFSVGIQKCLDKGLIEENWYVQETMPPRRAPARDDDDVDIHQMAYAMNTMAAAVTA